MLKHPKRPRDPFAMAVQIGKEATGQEPKQAVHDLEPGSFAARGRMGGLKGGKARARKLTKGKRTAIARKAALARWKKKRA